MLQKLLSKWDVAFTPAGSSSSSAVAALAQAGALTQRLSPRAVGTVGTEGGGAIFPPLYILTVRLTLFQSEEQIMPMTLILLAPPYFQSFLQPWALTSNALDTFAPTPFHDVSSFFLATPTAWTGNPLDFSKPDNRNSLLKSSLLFLSFWHLSLKGC